MTAGTRGKGKPSISEIAKVVRPKHAVPLSAIHVDTAGAGSSQRTTQGCLDYSKELAELDTSLLEVLDWIPDDFYTEIVQHVPILCVDLIIRRNTDANILLVRRKVDPLAEEWWVPGGAVKWGERDLLTVVDRIANTEVGKEVWDANPIGYYNEIFRNTPHGTKHTLSIVFDCETDNLVTPKVDDNHYGWAWSTTLPELFIQRCNLSHKMFR